MIQLKQDIPDIIKGEEFRESIKDTIRTEFNKIVTGDAFRNNLLASVTSQLESDRTVERAILSQALAHASDRNESDATRALGLQLFTLLHDSVRQRDPDLPKLREVFVGIIHESKGSPLPRRLNSVVLEYYPIGERDDQTYGECQEIVQCERWDHAVTDYVLSAVSNDRFQQDWTQFANFFRSLPTTDAHRAARWCLENWSSPMARSKACTASSARPSRSGSGA